MIKSQICFFEQDSWRCICKEMFILSTGFCVSTGLDQGKSVPELTAVNGVTAHDLLQGCPGEA